MPSTTTIPRYRLKKGERDVSDEGFALVKQYRAQHNGEQWCGITDQLLHEKYGNRVRHVLGYGWVLAPETVDNRLDVPATHTKV